MRLISFFLYMLLYGLEPDGHASLAENEGIDTEMDVMPIITRGPPKIEYFIKDDPIYLPCTASGVPKPTYQWYKNGQLFENNTTGGLRLLWSSGSEKALEGYYQCRAINRVGVALSNVTFLESAKSERIVSDPTLSYTIFVSDGNSALLPCNNTFIRPAPVCTWFYCDTTGDNPPDSLKAKTDCGVSKGKQIEPNNRDVYLLTNGDLIVTDVNAAKAARLYRCDLYRPIFKRGNDFSNFVVLSLRNATEDSTLSGRGAVLYVSSSPLIGSVMTLHCFFVSGEGVLWRLQRESGNVVTIEASVRHRLTHKSNSLTIDNLQADDAGTYVCSTRSGYEVNIDVIVEELPVIRTAPANQTVGPNSTVVFRCVATGIPRPEIRWLVNGDLVDDSSYLRNSGVTWAKRESGLELELSSLPDKYSSSVHCNASNRHGYQLVSALLRVRDLYPPKMVTSPLPLTSDARTGDDVMTSVDVALVTSTNVAVTNGAAANEYASITGLLSIPLWAQIAIPVIALVIVATIITTAIIVCRCFKKKRKKKKKENGSNKVKTREEQRDLNGVEFQPQDHDSDNDSGLGDGDEIKVRTASVSL